MSQGGWQPPPGGGGYGPPGQQPPATQAPATAPTMMAPTPAPGTMQPYSPSPPTQQSYGSPQQPGFPPQQQPGYGAPPQPYAPPNPYAQPGQAPGAMPPGYGFGQYEFNEMENAIIAKTAGRAKVWGIVSIIFGSLYVLSALFFFLSPALLINLAPGIGGIVVGVAFVGVANSLQAVVQTQGNDVEHMMMAVQKLGGAFLTSLIAKIVEVVLYLLLAVVVFLFLMVMFAAGGP